MTVTDAVAAVGVVDGVEDDVDVRDGREFLLMNDAVRLLVSVSLQDDYCYCYYFHLGGDVPVLCL